MAKKDIQLNVRVSKEAKQLIADNAKLLGMKQGEYIETIARKGLNQIIEINNPELDMKYERILEMLDKAGTNINQITTRINGGYNLKDYDLENINRMIIVFKTLYDIIDKKQDRSIVFNNNQEE